MRHHFRPIGLKAALPWVRQQGASQHLHSIPRAHTQGWGCGSAARELTPAPSQSSTRAHPDFAFPRHGQNLGDQPKGGPQRDFEPSARCFALPELHHVEVLRSWGQKQFKDHQEVASTLNPPPAGLQLVHPRAVCYCAETPARYHQHHQRSKQRPPQWLLAQFCYRLPDFKTQLQSHVLQLGIVSCQHSQEGARRDARQTVLLPTLARQRWRRPLTATRTSMGRTAPCHSASLLAATTSCSYSVVATSSSWRVLTAGRPWRSRGWRRKQGQGSTHPCGPQPEHGQMLPRSQVCGKPWHKDPSPAHSSSGCISFTGCHRWNCSIAAAPQRITARH